MKIKIISFVDNLFSRKVTCSVGDILLRGNTLDEGQLTILSRYYDLLEYYSGRNLHFPFQNAISYLLWGDSHDEQSGNTGFMKLIESYEKDGYREDSLITLDRDLSLMNGSHRVAMNLYHGYWNMRAKVLYRRIKKCRGYDWYADKGLQKYWLNILNELRIKVEKSLFEEGITLAFVADVDSQESELELTSILNSKIRKYKLYHLSKESKIFVQVVFVQPNYLISKGGLRSLAMLELVQQINFRDIHVSEVAANCIAGKALFEKYMDKRVLNTI